MMGIPSIFYRHSFQGLSYIIVTVLQLNAMQRLILNYMYQLKYVILKRFFNLFPAFLENLRQQDCRKNSVALELIGALDSLIS